MLVAPGIQEPSPKARERPSMTFITSARHPGRQCIATAFAILPLVLAACGTAASPSASPSTIHVIEHPTNVTYVKVGSISDCTGTTCLGDYYAGSSSMTDATTGKVVGTFVFECFVVNADSGLFHCPSDTLDLTGRGQIVFTESVYIGNKDAPPSWPWPIIGGTGEFLGGTGTVSSPADSTAADGDFVITLSR
jgi:hypothetical protein